MILPSLYSNEKRSLRDFPVSLKLPLVARTTVLPV